jgi:hypothetical protein
MGLGRGLNGVALALASLQNQGGVGPDLGSHRYDPNAPHQVHHGAATRIPTKHYDTLIPGQQGDKGEAYSIQVLGAPDKSGKSQVPYYRVYSDYSKAAEHALDREEVPGPYRDRVKDYFESLKPESK